MILQRAWNVCGKSEQKIWRRSSSMICFFRPVMLNSGIHFKNVHIATPARTVGWLRVWWCIALSLPLHILCIGLFVVAQYGGASSSSQSTSFALYSIQYNSQVLHHAAGGECVSCKNVVQNETERSNNKKHNHFTMKIFHSRISFSRCSNE